MGSLELLRGTVDVLILKTLSWGPLHGYGISRAIRNATENALTVEEGALYPALRRLENKELVESSWGKTPTGREAKFYRLTKAGSATLEKEVRSWTKYVAAMAGVIEAEGPSK